MDSPQLSLGVPSQHHQSPSISSTSSPSSPNRSTPPSPLPQNGFDSPLSELIEPSSNQPIDTIAARGSVSHNVETVITRAKTQSISSFNAAKADRVLSPPPAGGQTRWQRKKRKIRSLTSSSIFTIIFHSIICLALWVAANVIWVFVSTRWTTKYVFFLDQLTTFAFVALATPLLLLRGWKNQRDEKLRKDRAGIEKEQGLVREEAEAVAAAAAARARREQGAQVGDEDDASVAIVVEPKADESKVVVDESKAGLSFFKIGMIGLIDAFYYLLSTAGSAQTPGPFQSLLFQLPIPLCMTLAVFLFKQKYRRGQIIGATLILIGAAVSIVPSLVGSTCSVTAVLLYGAGVCFYGINCSFKEWALKSTTTDVLHLLLVANGFNFCVTFLLSPILIIPHLGTVDTTDTLIPHFRDGATCFFAGYDPGRDPVTGVGVDCDGIWIITVIYSIVGVLSSAWILVVINLGSAVVLNILSALQLSVSNIVFASPLIMGHLVTSFTTPMLIGLFIACAGFVIYTLMPMERGQDWFTLNQSVDPAALGSGGARGAERGAVVIVWEEGRKRRETQEKEMDAEDEDEEEAQIDGDSLVYNERAGRMIDQVDDRRIAMLDELGLLSKPKPNPNGFRTKKHSLWTWSLGNITEHQAAAVDSTAVAAENSQSRSALAGESQSQSQIDSQVDRSVSRSSHR